ncbi:DNA-binding bromodomain-containing protein [Hirschfeldia incana]|nr:DNA-binding bromodomain-containing protein [Hirschfeldia incana]
MTKPENDNNQTWSTWEELLLACAVHRHGIDSWDSVAAEIHKQNSSSRTLTAFDCRRRYNDLKRRFSPPEGETVSEISWWLEELRKLRVDELRREVERYDLSISSLQMKVKRLEDEREKEEATESSDLVKLAETGLNSDVPVIEPNQEIDESIEEKPNRIGGEETEEKPVREDSGRGSCESGAKDSVREGNDSPEFVEAKETSDVQSSASLPRKEETVGHDQPDNEDQSLAVNKTSVESGPLIDFIEMIRLRPIGSHFWRRLESQETPEYENIIRQHIDLDLVRTRVDEGYYQSSKTKFFRDLLLLINNAKVFYGDRSPESNSATQLHELIKKQMTTLKTSNQTSPPKEEPLVTSKEELTLLSLKTKVSASIKACRKRSSLAARPSIEPFKKKTKVVPTTDENEKKQVSETEEEDETTDKDEEPIVNKKTPRGRTTTSSAKKVVTRNVKTSLDDGGGSEMKKSDQEKKGKTTTNAGSKKQSAASFLKRMKGADTVPETVKAESSSGKKGAEQRRSNTKHEKDANQKRTPAKKNTSAASKREASEKEEGSSTRPKKRTRRL